MRGRAARGALASTSASASAPRPRDQRQQHHDQRQHHDQQQHHDHHPIDDADRHELRLFLLDCVQGVRGLADSCRRLGFLPRNSVLDKCPKYTGDASGVALSPQLRSVLHADRVAAEAQSAHGTASKVSPRRRRENIVLSDVSGVAWVAAANVGLVWAAFTGKL